jgi:hypothetical protein
MDSRQGDSLSFVSLKIDMCLIKQFFEKQPLQSSGALPLPS